MKITLFGATGPTGIVLTQKALAAGHSVTVYARNPAKLAVQHPRLTVIRGTLDESDTVARAISGSDAVISVLGPAGRVKGRPITAGMRAIVAAMQAQGVRRLIVTATPSARDPRDRFVFSFACAVRLVRLLLPEVYADIVGWAEVVRASGLDWTLVRLPMLTDRPGKFPPVAGPVGTPGLNLFSLSRDVLAEFLLAQLEDRAWLGQAPAISNRR